jgi:hypothetical protein
MIGYSFITAIELYSIQSISAIDDEIYAKSFEPIIGVFNPTFGGFFLLYSLILPFVIIPIIGLEKEQNTHYLLMQLPIKYHKVFVLKVSVALLFVVISLSMIIPAILFWVGYGGHIDIGEIGLLIFGYFLYGTFVVAISFFSASLLNDYASASVVALLLILFWWIVDFGSNSNYIDLSTFNVIDILKEFENGVLSLFSILYFFLVSIGLFWASYMLLRFDLRYRFGLVAISMIGVIIVLLLVHNSKISNLNYDITQSQRNSFEPKYQKALNTLQSLQIDIYLSSEDSRYKDYQKEFLDKLRFCDIKADINKIDGTKLKENYGIIVYKIDGKSYKTYSNSSEEFFDMIPKQNTQNLDNHIYSGYPLVIKSDKIGMLKYLYYLIIPLLMIMILINRKRNENI